MKLRPLVLILMATFACKTGKVSPTSKSMTQSGSRNTADELGCVCIKTEPHVEYTLVRYLSVAVGKESSNARNNHQVLGIFSDLDECAAAKFNHGNCKLAF